MQENFIINIYYKYTPVADPEGFVAWHKELCAKLGLTGRILIAKEGINGTLEGTQKNIDTYEAELHAQDGSAGTFGDFSDVWFKQSPGTGNAFPRMRIKVRKEIVSLGLGTEDVDPNQTTGTHISAEELKQWFESGEDFEIIDMRNDYEYRVGHFKGAHDPGTENFRDLPKAMPKLEPLKEKKVLTVCTYGVRCEKASGYLKKQGFHNVYQLHGGIGSYMKKYPGEDFLGSLYVFDSRLTERFTDTYEVVGTCEKCGTKSERFVNCDFSECHSKLLICETCTTHDGGAWCSANCKDEILTK